MSPSPLSLPLPAAPDTPLLSPGLYCHIPFCKTKCPYCNFSSTTRQSLIIPFLESISREAGLYSQQVPSSNSSPPPISPYPAFPSPTSLSPISLFPVSPSPVNPSRLSLYMVSPPTVNLFPFPTPSPFVPTTPYIFPSPYTSTSITLSPFDTLYLGGGTPSILSPAQIEGLLHHLHDSFTFRYDCEVTLEANPGDLTHEYLEALLDLGINRLNIGIQSFTDKNLRFLGRRHTSEEAKKAMNKARKSGFTNLGIDLIYGLPSQTMESWREDLEQALEWGPEHISCYQLTIEEGTVFGRRQKRGVLAALSEGQGYDFFITTARRLKRAGYLHYEVSNFAREERYISRHNSKYWQHSPYLGLGPSAHSLAKNRRWWNETSIERYCAALKCKEFHVAGGEELTLEALRLETLYFSFRTYNGLNLKRFRELFGQDLSQEPAGVLDLLVSQKRITIEGDIIRPTLEGFAVADAMTLLF